MTESRVDYFRGWGLKQTRLSMLFLVSGLATTFWGDDLVEALGGPKEVADKTYFLGIPLLLLGLLAAKSAGREFRISSNIASGKSI